MRRGWWGAAALAVAVAGASGAGGREAPYRISGTAVISGGQSVAIVALAGGDSILVREGDELDGGRVVEITPEWITLRYPDGDRRMWLAAGERGAAPAGGPASGVVLKSEAQGHHLIIEVDGLALARALAAPGPAQGGAGPEERLVALLGLPQGSAITDVNETPLATLGDPVTRVQQLLGEQASIRLNLDGGAGHPRRVYVMPRQEP